MLNSIAENLLKQGQELREQGKTLEALDFLHRAMQNFAAQKNYSRFVHCLLDRAICWQHLYQFTENNFGFAVLYKKDAESMLEIVETKNVKDELHHAYFMLAKASILFGEYGKAIENFEKSIEFLPPDRKTQRGDWLTNLGKAQYLNGQKENGVQTILDGIEAIKQFFNEVDLYTANVWLSGGYLRLAEILKNDNPKESKKYLTEAENLIKSDASQIVRKKQLENFIKTDNSGI